MKKSVLALAVLGAFAGAASAQSSVTLYGRLDTAVTWSDRSDDESVTTLNGHNPIGGSRWGLKGTEDLGGGLKANFTLESGFNSDTGAPGNATRLFDRQSWISLSSTSLGELRLGRQDTLTRQLNLTGATEVTGEGELTVADTFAGRALFSNFGSRVDNSVGYYSPSFGGFQVRALVAAGEGATARQQGVMLYYGAGPLKAGVTFESYDEGPVDDSYNEVVTIGGSYNFGVATVALGYQNVSDFGSNTALSTSVEDVDAYNIGLIVPLGKVELRAQYTRSEADLLGGGTDDQDKFGLSLRYALSKRTVLYTAAIHRDSDNKDDASNTINDTQLVFAVGHNF